MKILLLPRYSRNGASTRLRFLQYLPILRAQGIEVIEAPFFDECYLHRLYAGSPAYGSVIRAFCRRFSRLLTDSGADLIWLEKEALPWLPWWFERRLLPRHVPIVSDYDDAVFHRYDLHRSRFVRWLLGSKIGAVMAASRLVMAGNRYLADHAIRAGARQVETVPTVVDLEHYRFKRIADDEGQLRIGWIGTPGTWRDYMTPMMPLLIEVAGAHGARLRVVGAGPAAEAHPLLELRPWSEATEVSDIQQMDIGIMPLDDSPWSRGKCGYKLIQYMACGLPVVASPVGVNCEIVEHGVNGFLARTEAEWREALSTLLRDADLRRRMGQAGRKKVETHYSLQVWGPRVAQLLRNAALGAG
ncbi:Glycosyltransferase involved in cell wall bisynthesis [Fontimonas thermophila]|uniref:Glycosyltransferase involved in cell wall bisynthesis n=1 Tax=Fontimonas thermophila TaxID=1076937 RepID=A0A1I2IM36_9GAMM|nr:glycosyltransferase family 4 protein [Fontimonas thermophila]SFF42678.1 Glycosyltransferase involved in cell wall bisynthesis [Fontimonas thermophila]